MPRPSHPRVLSVPLNSGSDTIGLAYQDGSGHRQIWKIPYARPARDQLYTQIVDLAPNLLITTNLGYMDLIEAVRAVCLTRRIPIVFHATTWAHPFRVHAIDWLVAHRSFANAYFTDEERDALAGLLCHLAEVERDQLARALR